MTLTHLPCRGDAPRGAGARVVAEPRKAQNHEQDQPRNFGSEDGRCPKARRRRLRPAESLGLGLPEMRQRGFVIAAELTIKYHAPAYAAETLAHEAVGLRSGVLDRGPGSSARAVPESPGALHQASHRPRLRGNHISALFEVHRQVEGRGLAKGNAGGQNAFRTQSRGDASSALDRVRQAPKRDKGQRFTALLHHVDVERLRTAFRYASGELHLPT
jgi:hypothetical protein